MNFMTEIRGFGHGGARNFRAALVAEQKVIKSGLTLRESRL